MFLFLRLILLLINDDEGELEKELGEEVGEKEQEEEELLCDSGDTPSSKESPTTVVLITRFEVDMLMSDQ